MKKQRRFRGGRRRHLPWQPDDQEDEEDEEEGHGLSLSQEEEEEEEEEEKEETREEVESRGGPIEPRPPGGKMKRRRGLKKMNSPSPSSPTR